MAQSKSTFFVTETVTSYRPQTFDNVVTSFIPLPSAFTPDPHCYTDGFHNNIAEQFDYVLVAFDPSYEYYAGSSSIACVPPEVSDWYLHRTVQTDTTATVQTTTSLPTVRSLMPVTCPDGWYTAGTSTARPTIMQVTCCPSGYSVDPSQDHNIEANCDSTLDPGQSIWYLPTTGEEMLQTAFTDTVHVVAVAVKGYMPLTTTTSAPFSGTSTVAPASSLFTTTSTAVPTSLPSYLPSTPTKSNTPDSQTSSSSSSHTSGGTIAGSVIGSLAAVGLIGLGAFMFFRRRKTRQTKENDNSAKNEEPIPPSTPTLYDYSVVSQSEPGDRSTILSEMPTLSNTPELFSEHDPTSPRTKTESYELE